MNLTSSHRSSSDDSPEGSETSQKVARKRKGGRRSKTGCITCRIRRIKCDEQRPDCTRCTSTGRKCDGYPSIFAAAQPWEFVEVQTLGSIIRPSSNPRLASNDHAARSFSFFQSKTAAYLSGCFESELWNEIILCAAQNNDAIWYATIALGSAHQAIFTRKLGLPVHDEDWTFQQYNRAIRSLTQPNSRGEPPSVDVMIAASIMFMVFEMIRREYGRAISHIRSGVGMFGEFCSRKLLEAAKTAKSEPMIPFNHLEETLRTLEIQLCELSMDRYPPYPMPRTSLIGRKPLSFSDSDWPGTSAGFTTISEARSELDAYWHNLMFMLHELLEPNVFPSALSDADFATKGTCFHQAFTSWHINFQLLKSQLPLPPHQTSMERRALAQLEMHHLLGVQILETYLIPGEMIWDDYTHRFARVLDMCDIIAGSGAFGNPSCDLPREDTDCGFQLDQGVVTPCFHVIWKCRDAAVRDRAIRFLRRWPRQDGLWDGGLVAEVGVLIDEVERGVGMLESAVERGAKAAEVEEWRRVLQIDVSFSPEGRSAMITFLKRRSREDETLVHVYREMSWDP